MRWVLDRHSWVVVVVGECYALTIHCGAGTRLCHTYMAEYVWTVCIRC